jgi:hypothetical protein
MTDGVYCPGIEYLDSNSDMGDKLRNVSPIAITRQLNWWLGKISDNISQLEHFKEKYG